MNVNLKQGDMPESRDMPESTMEVNFKVQPFDLDFHPSSSILAVGLISGRVHLYKYTAGAEAVKVWSSRPHKESCRALRFADGGQVLLSVSPDCSIHATNVETGKSLARLSNAHEDAINRIINLTETTVATGDDGGRIKIWDVRQNKCCGSFEAHEDYVTDMEFAPDVMQLLGVSGDGTLSVCNLRRNKVEHRSEFSEDELLSVVLCKNGRKVICGSQTGVILLYSWGEFADCNDRFLGHPHSVDALLKVDDDTVVTGSSDGIIRMVSILPNKMIGVIGEHAEFPIERLAFSHDRTIIGSVSHDNSIKLWNMTEEDSSRANAGEESPMDITGQSSQMVLDTEKKDKGKKKLKQSIKSSKMENFFSDL